MADTTISTNMNLPIPIVGQDPGPTWAQDINACLTLVDLHNHTSGAGVPIPTSGLTIDADLAINNFNITLIKSARFTVQSAALAGGSDLGCLYVTGVDLYFNDVNGNHIQLTQSGGVAGSPGTISNLVSPASASYNVGAVTFVWQSNTTTPANTDCGSVILRNISASSKGLTLSPPSSMAADYTLTLPALPASQKMVTCDASGNLSAAWAPDNSSIEVSSNVFQVKAGGVTEAMLAPRTTGTTVAAGGVALSADVSSTASSTSLAAISGLSVTITTTGRPVIVMMTSSTSGSNASIGLTGPVGSPLAVSGIIEFVRGATGLGRTQMYMAGGTSNTQMLVPPSSFMVIDPVAAGTYTYIVKGAVGAAGNLLVFTFVRLMVYEM